MESSNLSSNKRNETNTAKEKNILNNIKNDYLLKEIFNILPQIKTLAIIKYNKNIRQRINLDINIYKEYSEKYSTIEIELIPYTNSIGKFIDIIKEQEQYYHIYYDDNKEEIKRYSLDKNDKVSKIKIIIDYPVDSLLDFFSYCKCIYSIYFKKFCRNNIIDMRNVFYKCEAKKINISNFNTDNVLSMHSMFWGCYNLEEINFPYLNTINVTDMSNMFSNCCSLKEIDLSNFNIINVSDMNNIFDSCSKLKKNKSI